MKKTILASLVASLFTATAVNAVEVYNQDGITLGLYGDAEVQLVSDMTGEYTKKDGSNPGHGNDANQGYLNLDDADFGFKLGYDINESIKIGAVVEFSGEDGSADLGDAYVGVIFDKIAVTAGKQVTILDDAGIGQDYAFGFDTAIDDSLYEGKQVIKVKVDYGMVYGGVAYLLNGDEGVDDAGRDNSIDNNTNAIDANIGLRVAGLDAAVFYGESSINNDIEANTLIAQAVYSFESFNFGAFFSTAETQKNDKTTKDTLAYGLSGQYLVNNWDFAIGAGQVANNQNKGEVGYFEDYYIAHVNAGYAFSSNVHVFAEVGFSDEIYVDSNNVNQDAEIGLAAGIKVEF